MGMRLDHPGLFQCDRFECWLSPRACGLRYLRAQSVPVYFLSVDGESEEIRSFLVCSTCERGRSNAVGKIMEGRTRKSRRRDFTWALKEFGYGTERELFKGMSVDYGFGQKDIAKRLKCSQWTVGKRLARYGLTANIRGD